MSKLLATHCFRFDSSKNNSGEGVYLTTEIRDNGDKTENIFLSQKMTLNSYGKMASISFLGELTPENLRKLADELEAEINRHKR